MANGGPSSTCRIVCLIDALPGRTPIRGLERGNGGRRYTIARSTCATMSRLPVPDRLRGHRRRGRGLGGALGLGIGPPWRCCCSSRTIRLISPEGLWAGILWKGARPRRQGRPRPCKVHRPGHLRTFGVSSRRGTFRKPLGAGPRDNRDDGRAAEVGRSCETWKRLNSTLPTAGGRGNCYPAATRNLPESAEFEEQAAASWSDGFPIGGPSFLPTICGCFPSRQATVLIYVRYVLFV
jgi:hypothetical protein